ncbi:hypothetical protein DV737_g606, partial [Chaetothyriales sp. CBS 132003]
MWLWYDESFHEQAITACANIEADGLDLNPELRPGVYNNDYDEAEEVRATIAGAKRDLVGIPEVGKVSGFAEISPLARIPGLLGIKEADDYVLTEDLTTPPIAPRTIILNTGEQINVPQQTVPVDMGQIFEKKKNHARPDSPLKHCETTTYDHGDISTPKVIVQREHHGVRDSTDDKAQQEDPRIDNDSPQGSQLSRADYRYSSTKVRWADYEEDDESCINDASLYNKVEPPVRSLNSIRDVEASVTHPQPSLRPGGGQQIPRSLSIKTHEGTAKAFMNQCKRIDQQAVRTRRLDKLKEDDKHAALSDENRPLCDESGLSTIVEELSEGGVPQPVAADYSFDKEQDSVAPPGLVPALATTMITTMHPSSLDSAYDFSFKLFSSAPPPAVQESGEERTAQRDAMTRQWATPTSRAARDRQYAENWWSRTPEQIAQIYGDGTEVQDGYNDAANETSTTGPTPQLLSGQEENEEQSAPLFFIVTMWQRRRGRIASRWLGEVEHKLQKRNRIGEAEGKKNLFRKAQKAIFGFVNGKKKKEKQSKDSHS